MAQSLKVQVRPLAELWNLTKKKQWQELGPKRVNHVAAMPRQPCRNSSLTIQDFDSGLSLPKTNVRPARRAVEIQEEEAVADSGPERSHRAAARRGAAAGAAPAQQDAGGAPGRAAAAPARQRAWLCWLGGRRGSLCARLSHGPAYFLLLLSLVVCACLIHGLAKLLFVAWAYVRA